MRMHSVLASGVLAVAIFGSAPGANAAVVFSDNFNSYAYQLNWVPPAAWTVPSGSVDLIGETTTATNYDFFPGDGGYVDLDGSTGQAGTLETSDLFTAGKYTLTFDLAGNARDDGAKTTTISLGNWSTTLTLPSSSPYQLYTYTFSTTGGALSFADSAGGNQDIGNVLDNVTVMSIPESGSWAMIILGFAGLGFVGYRKAMGERLALFAT